MHSTKKVLTKLQYSQLIGNSFDALLKNVFCFLTLLFSFVSNLVHKFIFWHRIFVVFFPFAFVFKVVRIWLMVVIHVSSGAQIRRYC